MIHLYEFFKQVWRKFSMKVGLSIHVRNFTQYKLVPKLRKYVLIKQLFVN